MMQTGWWVGAVGAGAWGLGGRLGWQIDNKNAFYFIKVMPLYCSGAYAGYKPQQSLLFSVKMMQVDMFRV